MEIVAHTKTGLPQISEYTDRMVLFRQMFVMWWWWCMEETNELGMAGLMGVLGGPVRIDGGRWVCSRVEMVEEEEHRLSAQ